MACTRLLKTKDGRQYYEIICHKRGRGQKSMRWYVPEGWSARAIEHELSRQVRDFESKFLSGDVLTRIEAKEAAEAEAAERAKLKSLRQYAEGVFMATKETTISENTKANYKQFLDKHILPYLGDELLADISPAMLTKRIVDFQKGNVAHASAVKLYNILNGIFDMAFMDDSIPINPMLKVKRPAPKKDEHVTEECEKALTIESLSYVLSCVEHEPLKWKTFINLIADTGCRRGEICGLEWNDVDMKTQTVTIRHNIQYTPGKGVYDTTPKNGKIRRVDIGDDTVTLLRHWKAEQAKECVCKYVFNPEKSNQYKHAEKNPDGNTNKRKKGKKSEDRVIPIETSPMHPQTPTRYFKKFGDKYGIPGFHPHLLRHTSASIAITNGGDIVSVSQRLGHSDTAVTLRMYAHANEESIRHAGQVVRDALKASMAKAT